MKDLSYLNVYRDKWFDAPNSGLDKTKNGVFHMVIDGVEYSVIASDTYGWDHVSISSPVVIPTWDVMENIKKRFFKDDEFTVEFFPKKEDYVNNVNTCLHMWRPNREEMPYPDIQAIDKEKPRLKSKQLFIFNNIPYACVLAESDHYEILTIKSGFNKRPGWGVVSKIKEEIFGDTVAVSYHGKKGDKHQKMSKDKTDTITIWRPIDLSIPTPPAFLVGLKGFTEKDLDNMGIETVEKLLDEHDQIIDKTYGHLK